VVIVGKHTMYDGKLYCPRDCVRRSVRSFVRSYICSQVEYARGQLQQYAERFSVTMIKALDVARAGEGCNRHCFAWFGA
jgi:hypothetical protein